MRENPIDTLTETDLEELAYNVERARQIVQLKALAERDRVERQNGNHSDLLPQPVTTCLELAEQILQEVVGRLQEARANR